MKGGKSVVIEPHRHEGECVYSEMMLNCDHWLSGVFIARGREDALVTLNMVPGETVYREKKVSVESVSMYITIGDGVLFLCL